MNEFNRIKVVLVEHKKLASGLQSNLGLVLQQVVGALIQRNQPLLH